MPTARRITFGTQVVPTKSIELEETSVRHTEYMASPGKKLGGKGIATINATQWSDSWTSMLSEFVYWEALTDTTDVSGNRWEDVEEPWGGIKSVTPSGAALADDTSALAFLYIKNTGSTNEALVALDGGTNYYITIPAGGSTQLRGDGTQLLCNEVYVKCNGGESTNIEYIVAKG